MSFTLSKTFDLQLLYLPPNLAKSLLMWLNLRPLSPWKVKILSLLLAIGIICSLANLLLPPLLAQGMESFFAVQVEGLEWQGWCIKAERLASSWGTARDVHASLSWNWRERRAFLDLSIEEVNLGQLPIYQGKGAKNWPIDWDFACKRVQIGQELMLTAVGMKRMGEERVALALYSKEGSALFSYLRRGEAEEELTSSFRHLDILALLPLLPEQPIKMDGFLEGQCRIPLHRLKDFKGELTLEDGSLEDSFHRCLIPKGILSFQMTESALSYENLHLSLALLDGAELQTLKGRELVSGISGEVACQRGEIAFALQGLEAKGSQKIAWHGQYSSLFGQITFKGEAASLATSWEQQNAEKRWQISLEGLGQREFQALKALCSPYYPALSLVDLKQGSVTANCQLTEADSSITRFSLENLKANHLSLDLASASLKLQSLEGYLQWQKDEAGKEMLSADLSIAEGALQSQSLSQKTGFEQIQGRIQLQEGQLLRSTLQASLKGMKGTVNFKWPSKRECIHLSFYGDMQHLLTHLPLDLNLQQRLFNQDQVAFSADVIPYSKGLQICAEIDLFLPEAQSDHGPPRAERHRISLGWDLEWAKRPPSLGAPSSTGFALSELLPKEAFPALKIREEAFLKEEGIGGLIVRNGWFSSKEVPFHKFISLYGKPLATFEAVGDVLGEFDHQGMTVWYTLQKARLGNEQLQLEIEEKEQEHLSLFGFSSNQEKKKGGFCYIDFQKGRYLGQLKVEHAHLLAQGSKIAANGTVFFSDAAIYAPAFHLFGDGFSFEGALEYTQDKFTLSSHSAKGTLSAVRKLMQQQLTEESALKTPFFNFPLEGVFSMEPQRHFFKARWQGDEWLSECQLLGQLKEGYFTASQETPFLGSIEEVSCRFAYRSREAHISFEEIQCQVPLPLLKEPILLTAPKLSLQYLDSISCPIDIVGKLGDQEILHFTGHIQDDGKGNTLNVSCDLEKSHFFQARAQNCALQLSKKGIETLAFNLPLHLRLKKELFCDAPFLESTEELVAEGPLFCHLFKEEEEPLQYKLQSDSLSLLNKKSALELSGSLKGSSWRLKKGSFADWEAALNAYAADGTYVLEKLKIWHHQALKFRGDGHMASEEGEFYGEVAFSFLDSELIAPLLSKNLQAMRGQFFGKGSFSLLPKEKLLLEIDLAGRDLECLSYRIEEIAPFYLHYDSRQGLSLHAMQLKIEGKDPLSFQIDTIQFDTVKQETTATLEVAGSEEGLFFFLRDLFNYQAERYPSLIHFQQGIQGLLAL
ncbi:MAG: pmp, partial [Chlamydiales bacterium]|nr:pmp [Chlamydiales bacterium]